MSYQELLADYEARMAQVMGWEQVRARCKELLPEKERLGHWTKELLDGQPPEVLDELYWIEFREGTPRSNFCFMASADEVRDCLLRGEKYKPPKSFYDNLEAGAVY